MDSAIVGGGGVTLLEDGKMLHKVAEGCDHLGKPKISHYIF